MKLTAVIFSFLFLLSGVVAQDSTQVLTYDQFIKQVLENHPYAYQAAIVLEKGESTIQKSRGAFDPKLNGNANQKYFDGTQYYSHLNGALKVPTWFGISLESGYQINEGSYLNPENRVPDAGLWYAGIRMELGNGLIIDQRRAELEKAKLYQQSTILENQILLNELKRDASITYWDWYRSYQEMNIYENALQDAITRLEATKGAAEFGDRPSIDTVEASLLVQNRKISLVKAKTKYKNSIQKIEMYLWEEGMIPLELNNAIPEIASEKKDLLLPLSFDSLIQEHPFLAINRLMLDQLEVDLKLKREQLKPQVTLKYNAISEPVNGNPIPSYSSSNYTWGATFAYPLFLRKERGEVQLGNLKVQEQEVKFKTETAKLTYNLNSVLNDYYMNLEQFEMTKEMVSSSVALFETERTLFELGESSVFMINSRENYWLQLSIQKIQAENQCRTIREELEYLLMPKIK